MFEFGLHHLPLVGAGALVGALAFLPLVLVLEPVLRGKRDASFGKGGPALAVSFGVLLASFLVVYVLFDYDAVAVAAGLATGFAIVWLAVAIRVIMLP